MQNNYAQKISFKADGCSLITNVAIGRSEETMRLFVTCNNAAGKTVLKMFDRNLNGELEKPGNKRVLNAAEKIIETIISNTHMIYR